MLINKELILIKHILSSIQSSWLSKKYQCCICTPNIKQNTSHYASIIACEFHTMQHRALDTINISF